LQRHEFGQVGAGRDELRLGEVLVHGRLPQGVQTTDPHGEVGPVVVAGPFLLAGQRDRGDGRGLQLADRLEILRPGGRGRAQPGPLEELLVVPEADHAGVDRGPVDLAVDRVRVEGIRDQRVPPLTDVRGEVLDQSRLGLLGEHAAAPGVEDVRRVAGLDDRGQLGLERLVLQRRDVELDAGVGRLELTGHLGPLRHHRVGVGDVPPADGLARAGLPAVVAASGQGGAGRGRGGQAQ
jgi:hypothetical protein